MKETSVCCGIGVGCQELGGDGVREWLGMDRELDGREEELGSLGWDAKSNVGS